MLRDERKLTRPPVADSEQVADPYIVAVMSELQDGRSTGLATMQADVAPVKLASRRTELLRKNY